MTRKLNAYRGRLSAAQTAEGMNAASANACRLAEDAQHLFELGSFPTSASVAALSIEEAGKLSILRSLALATSDADVAQAWKDYRSHTRKNAAWILPQLVASGASTLEDMRPIFDASSDHPHVLDQVKQLGFYTDCLGTAHWTCPADTITRELAQQLVAAATVMKSDTRHSAREIELWIEHIGPVWKREMAWMQQGLVNWYSAMQTEGLMPPGHNKMQSFVHSTQR